MNNETCEKCGYLLRNHKYKDDKYNCPEINIETQPSCTCTGITTHSWGCPCYKEPVNCDCDKKYGHYLDCPKVFGTSFKEDWELSFDIEFEDCKVVHVFDTDQYKKIKEYIRTLLAQQAQTMQKPAETMQMNVSKWNAYGRSHGYWSYFRDLMRADWTNEMIKWAEKNQTRCEKCDGAKDLQHTLACNFKQDLLKKLKELE